MVSCQGEYSSSYDSKQSSSEDIKPSYLVGYGSAPPSNPSESKSDYDSYYNKLQSIKEGEMKVPKAEITSTSCCNVSGPGRNELLVPKTEVNTCRSSPTPVRPGYDSYINQDSNSSSMSSVEAMNPRAHHQLSQHHSIMSQHPQQPGYAIDERQHQMPHRSPYHQSPLAEDMYHRPDHPMRNYELSESMGGGIARPVVTYSNELRGYESSMVNSGSHRPYDPGTNTAFERYDSSSQCGSLQQSIMPPRVPPQGMYGYGSMEDQQDPRYQQEVAQQHQMALANATAAGMMKSPGEPESSGPLYPR